MNDVAQAPLVIFILVIYFSFLLEWPCTTYTLIHKMKVFITYMVICNSSLSLIICSIKMLWLIQTISELSDCKTETHPFLWQPAWMPVIVLMWALYTWRQMRDMSIVLLYCWKMMPCAIMEQNTQSMDHILVGLYYMYIMIWWYNYMI